MNHKILIVEDDPTIREQLKTLLLGNGYTVETISEFANAAEQVKACSPHLVLLDIRLPGCSGFELCAQIRAFSDIPIIFVTGSNTDLDELNSILLGGDALLQNPTMRLFCWRKLRRCCGGRIPPSRRRY